MPACGIKSVGRRLSPLRRNVSDADRNARVVRLSARSETDLIDPAVASWTDFKRRRKFLVL